MKSPIKAGVFAIALCLPVGLCAVGCAPQPASDSGATEGGAAGEVPVVATSWSPDVDCGTCHTNEAATAQDSACLAGTHTMDQGFDCMTCHVDDSALSTAHADMNSGKMPKKLKDTEVDPKLCLSCHDQGELASATEASTVLTDDYGKTVNPHAVPENAEHAEEITCISCHQGHSTKGVAEDSADFCTGCHHANVYECGTCHE